MKKIIGTVHTDPDRWSQIIKQYGALIPRAPLDLVKVAVTPHPPQVPKTGDRLELALVVCRGYYAACMHAYGRCVRVDGPTLEDMKESGHVLTFSRAIDKLRDYKLAPAAWSAFSIEVWREFVVGGKGGQKWNSVPSNRRKGPSDRSQPTPNWVFSEKRLEERTGWFSYLQSRYAGGKVIFTPALKRLAFWHGHLKLQLMTADRLDAEIVKALVSGVVSKRVLDDHIEAANDEAADVMRNMRKRLKAGEFIW